MLPTMVYARFFIFQIHRLLRGRLHTGEFRRVCTRCGRTIDKPSDTDIVTSSDTESKTDTDSDSDTDTDIERKPIGLLGDVDTDEKISANDALSVLRASVGLTEIDDLYDNTDFINGSCL